MLPRAIEFSGQVVAFGAAKPHIRVVHTVPEVEYPFVRMSLIGRCFEIHCRDDGEPARKIAEAVRQIGIAIGAIEHEVPATHGTVGDPTEQRGIHAVAGKVAPSRATTGV